MSVMGKDMKTGQEVILPGMSEILVLSAALLLLGFVGWMENRRHTLNEKILQERIDNLCELHPECVVTTWGSNAES